MEGMTSSLSLPSSSYQVLFLTNKEPKNENLFESFEKTNFKTIVFKELATSEQMFETLIHSNETLGTVILVKESAVNINYKDFNKFIEKHQSGSKVVVSKQSKNKNWLTKVGSAIRNFFSRIFLGLKLFPGEADALLLDNVLVSTLSEIEGKSALLTKVNGWSGVEAKTAPFNEQTKQKQKFSFGYFKFPIIWSFLLVCMIIGNILFAVLNVNLPFLAYFAYGTVEVGLLALIFYSLSKSIFNFKYGNVAYVSKTDIVKIIDNYEE